MAVILSGEQHWVCPNCAVTAVTTGQPNRYHRCPGLAGLDAPMVLEGTDCKVVVVEREDYVGREDVRYDGNGRPIMAVDTVRPDGSNDRVVFAPCARMKVV